MPVMDEFKDERDSVKNGTLKEKFAYFWDYYKWYVIGGAAALFLVGSLIHSVVTKKEIAFYAMLMNAGTQIYLDDSDHTGPFAEYAGIDTDKFSVMYDTSIHFGNGIRDEYASLQKLVVYMASGEIDVILSDTEALYRYAYAGNFKDLRDFLSPEQFAEYEDLFYYIDGDIMREIAETDTVAHPEYQPAYADPRHPEDMKDPIPAGLFLKADCPLFQDYAFSGDAPAVSVLVNTKHPELASQFLDFLMQ